jgi:hypothetical protein
MTAAAFLVLLCSMPGVAATDNLVVPRDIYEFIKAGGCEQVSDFFSDRGSVEHPPYALRVLPWGEWDIAVWCTRDMRKQHFDREYSLLLRFDDPANPLSKCPRRIDGIKFIGGLTFATINEPAEWYYFIGTPTKVGGKRPFSTKAIKSIYDGTGHYYVCVDGKWAARDVH